MILASLGTPCFAQTVPSNDREMVLEARIDAIVAPLDEAGLVSGVILVARGDEILFQQAYGFANWELRTPNSASTRFGIASITKTLTGTLVDLLVAAGRLDLETPVEKYLPGFPRGSNGGVPTVGQLLEHRAGVPHRVTNEIEETEPLRSTDIVERVRSAGLLFEPGAQRRYSSAGYTCLARVIEVVEERPFEDVLAARVFAPARMTSATSETGQRLMDRRAMPYRLGAEERSVVVKTAPHKDLRFLTGAGSVYATAEDLLRFVRALRSGVYGEKLWGESFGPDASTWDGWSGRTNGYEGSVDVLPSADLTFVFLANLQSAANWQIREAIRNILLGLEPEPMPLPPPVGMRAEDPESIVGTYGAAEITIRDGALFRGDNEFYPIEGGRYYIPASGAMIRFRRDPAGRVDALVEIRPGAEERVLDRSEGS
ncbi:MAG TPA: serine hydrolase domain-containing protein [Thermoanaerobaculia bacterium]